MWLTAKSHLIAGQIFFWQGTIFIHDLAHNLTGTKNTEEMKRVFPKNNYEVTDRILEGVGHVTCSLDRVQTDQERKE